MNVFIDRESVGTTWVLKTKGTFYGKPVDLPNDVATRILFLQDELTQVVKYLGKMHEVRDPSTVEVPSFLQAVVTEKKTRAKQSTKPKTSGQD